MYCRFTKTRVLVHFWQFFHKFIWSVLAEFSSNILELATTAFNSEKNLAPKKCYRRWTRKRNL
jgi:hypothetical protein